MNVFGIAILKFDYAIPRDSFNSVGYWNWSIGQSFYKRPLVCGVRQPPPLLLALVLAACSRGPTGAHPPLSGGTNGPDAVLIRIAGAGGTAKAYRWGSDSVLWSSPQKVPVLSQTLAFDDAQGSLAYIDARGVPGRLDLRVGSAAAAATTALTGLASADGWAIYGVTPKHDVSRLTPSGTWTFTPEEQPRGLLPLPDGSLVLLSDNGTRHDLRRLASAGTACVTETTSVPHADLLVRTDIGDRLYFIGDSGLTGVRTRDLTRTKTVWLPGKALDAVATPSGDRIFVALKGKKTITVVDRFSEEIETTIDVGGPGLPRCGWIPTAGICSRAPRMVIP